MAEPPPGSVRLRVNGTDDFFWVPQEDVPLALAKGYVEPTEEELSEHDRRKAYVENTSRLEREVYGAGVGATTQLLGVPAMVANILPGVEGQSGGSWLANFAADMGGMDPAEAEEALRVIAEKGSTGHFAGVVGGSLIGTKGASALGKGAAAAAGANVGTKLATAGTVAESMAQHITMANEQAFVQNTELSADHILAASLLGGIGPLALGPGMGLVAKGARKGLSKVDAARLAKFEAAQGGQLSLAGMGPKAPAKFADLFSPDRATRLKALSGVAEELGEAAAVGKRAAAKAGARVGGIAEHLVRGPTVKQGGMGFGGSTTRGAILGALTFDGIMGAAVGGVAGAAVRRFGPRASGWALGKMADKLRSVAAEASEAAVSGAKRSLSPYDVVGRTALAAGNTYRSQLLGMLESSRETIDAAGNDPGVLTQNIAETYGGLPAPVVQAVTNSHLRAIAYLHQSMPPQPAINPGMPQAGRVSVPIDKLESYARKMEAVMDPLSVLRGLAAGDLHRDTVEAVRAVYPAMYMDIERQALMTLGKQQRALTKNQAIAFDKLLGNKGMVYGASNPGFQSRLGLAQALQEQSQGQSSAPKKPGRPRGSPTLGQSMRTSSQRAAESIGN